MRHYSFKGLHFFLFLQHKEEINWCYIDVETPPKAKGSFDLRHDHVFVEMLKVTTTINIHHTSTEMKN